MFTQMRRHYFVITTTCGANFDTLCYVITTTCGGNFGTVCYVITTTCGGNFANFALSFNVLNPFDCSKSLIIVDTCCNDVTESVKVCKSFIVMA
jgi:hypothetical protein